MSRFCSLIVLASSLIILVNSSCLNDDDLRLHHCQCYSINRSISCSTFPRRCRTCVHYQRIFFDHSVQTLTEYSFAEYRFPSQGFHIQFAHLINISTRAFSKIHLQSNQTLQIEILQYSSPILPTDTFDGLILGKYSEFHLKILNIIDSIFSIEQHAFHGIEFHHRSYFQFSILHASDLITFASNAGSMNLPAYARMDLNFHSFGQIIGLERCFHRIKQEEFSELRINFHQFHSASFSHETFSNIHQLAHSSFHLTLSNFAYLHIEGSLISNIKQFASNILIFIVNQTNNLCLTNETFSNIIEENKSLFQFNIHSGQNLFFSSQSIHHITLKSQSKFSINITNYYDVYFSRYSLTNFQLFDQSSTHIGIHSGQNLIFESEAIHQIEIFSSSLFQIGYEYSRGTFQMAMNGFSQISQDDQSQFQIQFSNTSDFYLRFNQSNSLKRLKIIGRWLTSVDFCRISTIPSDFFIELPIDNPCSCTMSYLSRSKCSKNLCHFHEQISNCHQMEGEIQINIPRGICSKEIRSIPSKESRSNILVIISSLLIVCLICMIILKISLR